MCVMTSLGHRHFNESTNKYLGKPNFFILVVPFAEYQLRRRRFRELFDISKFYVAPTNIAWLQVYDYP